MGGNRSLIFNAFDIAPGIRFLSGNLESPCFFGRRLACGGTVEPQRERVGEETPVVALRDGAGGLRERLTNLREHLTNLRERLTHLRRRLTHLRENLNV